MILSVLPGPLALLHCTYYAFPTGSVYGFGKKTVLVVAQAIDLRICKQSKNSAYIHDIVNKSGPISHIFLDWLNFNYHQWYGFKFKTLKTSCYHSTGEQPVYLNLSLVRFWQKFCQNWPKGGHFKNKKK